MDAGNLPCVSPHSYSRILMGWQTDGLSDGSTDKSNEVWMERKFPRNWTFRKLWNRPAILVGIFIMNLAQGWMVGWMELMMDTLTDGQSSR